MSGSALLTVRDLHCVFTAAGRKVHAVSGVSFAIRPGETLGLVGESGCGKTTLGRAIMQLPPPASGQVVLDGVDLCALEGAELRARRMRLQMIFQDPVSSLNPRRSIAATLQASLHGSGLSRSTRAQRAARMLEAVGLDPAAVLDRYPHELSGGQCQRVSIARALVLKPRLVICDEAVSSLDVSVQAQVLNLLREARRQFGLTLLFIAHDLAVVNAVSDRIAVMYLGRLCEIAPAGALVRAPAHPYTRLLLESMPALGRPGFRQTALPGSPRIDPPSPLHPPSGCRFRTRCPLAQPQCAQQVPPLREISPGRMVACHYAD